MRTLLIFTGLGLILLMGSFNPGIRYKKGIIYKDSSFYFMSRWDKLIRAYELSNVRDSIFLLLKSQYYVEPPSASNNYKSRNVNYLEGRMPGKDSVLFEISETISRKATMKYIAALLVKYDVLDQEGHAIRANLVRMSNDVGKPYSRKRDEIIRY